MLSACRSIRLALAGAIAFIIALMLLLIGGGLYHAARAFDKPEYENLDPKIRDWFRSVRSPKGIPCCDIADGHRTTWRGTSEGGYEVPIEGQWRKVPPEAVVLNAGNPIGEAIVWYVLAGPGAYHIRCFVPGSGA